MCGLFGWSLANVKHHSVKRAYRILSQGNDLRGGHSFGAYFVDSQRLLRGIGRMANATWPNQQSPITCSRVICHTRYATHGDVTVANAHPFRIEHIVGAHNGIIYNHHTLNEKYGRSYPVDSQHIFAHIAEGKDLSDLSGYGAITYVDSREASVIYLGRFCSGELAVARLSGDKGIVWSSSDRTLVAACRAAGWSFELLQIDDGELYMVDGTEIYSTLGKLGVSQSYRVWIDDEDEETWLKRMLSDDDEDKDNPFAAMGME